MHSDRFHKLEAAAGSGKTYALTKRLLNLLLSARHAESGRVCDASTATNCHVPEIMAVTFTNKAAVEMRERVLGTLKARALRVKGSDKGPGEAWTPKQARAFVDEVLVHYQDVNIRTIDSLLARLVSLFAVELGLPARSDTVFNPGDVVDLVYERLVRLCREEDEYNKELRRAFDLAMETLLSDPEQAAGGFFPVGTFKSRFAAAFAMRINTPGMPYVMDDASLVATCADATNELNTSARKLIALVDAANISVKKGPDGFMRALADPDINPLQVNTGLVFCTREHFVDLVIKKSIDDVTPQMQRAYEQTKDFLLEAVSNARLAKLARNTAPFLRLTHALDDELLTLQRERGFTFNSEWPGMVTSQLQEAGVPAAACKMGARLKHLLIDEFQDTSTQQWEAMRPLAFECLAQGGSFFFVGDVKQAIYGWRGGDAALFGQLTKDKELTTQAPATQDALEHNWRSAPTVVDFNNSAFGPLREQPHATELARRALAVRTTKVQPARTGSIERLGEKLTHEYALVHQKVSPITANLDGYVRAVRVDGPPAGKQERQRTAFLAELAALRERYRDSSIAILVREGREARQQAAWLLAEDIPVVTEESLSLAANPLIGQLVALLTLADYPYDDAAFVQLISGQELFGPALGHLQMGRDDLLDWCAGRPNRTSRGSASPLLFAFARDFPQAYERYLRPLVGRAGLQTAYDLTMRALDIFDVHRRHPQARGFLLRFLEIIHALEEREGGTLSSFLAHWKESGGQEKLPLSESVDAVRILTIHKSKGLEFEAVLMGFHDWKQKHFASSDVVTNSGDVIRAPLSALDGAHLDDALSAEASATVNLLYVAWTRARRELRLLITAPASGRERSVCYEIADQLLCNAGLPAAGEMAAEMSEAGGGTNDGEEALPHTQWGTPPPGDRHKATPPSPASTCPADEHAATGDSSPPPSPPTAEGYLPRLRVYRHFGHETRFDFDAAMRGTLLHAAAEHLWPPPAGQDPAPTIAAAVQRALESTPVLDADVGELRREMTACCQWLLDDPRTRPLLDHSRREVLVLDEKGARFRMDLLAALPTGDVVVADFKTGARDPEKHHAQLRNYMRLVRASRGADGPPVRGLLIYLDTREVEPVTETIHTGETR